MQEQVSDQLSDAEIQLQLDAAATPQQASPEVAEQPAPTKSSDPDPDTAHLEATPARGSAESSASPAASKRAGDIRRELLPSASGVPAAVRVAGAGSFFASPTTNGGIQPTTSPTTPEQVGAADGGHLVQQQQQHDAANLRITRLEADVTTIKESIETQSSSMAQMMAMMKFMVSQEARPKSDTITEPTTANSNRPQEEAQLGTDVILDTDLLTLIIWWQEKYGPVPRAYPTQWQRQIPRRYLLCRPDIPWQHDPQRENSTDRDRLFARYQLELSKRQCHFTVCHGTEHERLEQALAAIQNLS